MNASKDNLIFKAALYSAVSLAYVGEYNSLIAILEHARQLGGSSNAVIFYFVYCIPAIILLVLANVWTAGFSKARTYLPAVFALSALLIGSFVNAKQAGTVILCVFLIALFRQWTRALTFSLIKEHFEAEERNKLTSQIVSLRFVVMIIGATIGGYLGERQLFSLSLMINSICYLLAGAAMWIAIRHVGQPNVVEAVVKQTANFYQRMVMGSVGLSKSMGISLLAAVLIASLGANAFFALEYPILTSDLGIAPSKLFIVYMGHIAGALFAGKAGTSRWIADQSHGKTYLLAVLLGLSYAFVGLGSTNIIWISFQLGICAFLLPLFEIRYSAVLMNNAFQNYTSQNLTLNFYFGIISLIGATLPILLLGSFSSIESNRVLQSFAIATIVIAGIFLRNRKDSPKQESTKL